MKNKAFTLLEILTVLAIVFILIAIVLPSFRYAREQSRLVACTSNLKQNYLMLFAYADDFKGYWPKTDSPVHTNQFHNINSQNIQGPLYYLWQSGFVNQPKTWYCPAGKDLFETNWQSLSGKLQPTQNSAACGYQYRMYFAYNFPDLKTTATKTRQSPQLIGYIKPSQYRNLALWSDAFNYSKSLVSTNHQNLKCENVMFNDGAIIKRKDNGKIQKLDLSWSQAGDWQIPLADGSPDTRHNVAILWHFLDSGQLQLPVR